MERKNVISLGISIGSYQSFIDRMIFFAKAKKSSYVCVANVHMVIEAYRNNAFAAQVNSSDLTTPDGVPLTKAIRLLYDVRQPRVAGMDLLPDLLAESENQKIPVYFYGGTEDMLIKTKVYCEEVYPKLNITGMYSPPFRSLTAEELLNIKKSINDSNAGFVFVALGCPKQEKWMASMKGEIDACMVGIGGALPVMIGLQQRSPKWMQKNGLEWLYRLGQEPKRLFKRYFITNSMFLGLMAKVLIVEKLIQKKNNIK